PDISSLFYRAGRLSKVTFTIHNPNTLVEFYQDTASDNNSSSSTTEVRNLVAATLKHWQADDHNAMWREFSSLHRIVKKNPETLPELSAIGDLGKVYMIMVDHLRGGDEDFLQQLASIGYYLLSSGCE